MNCSFRHKLALSYLAVALVAVLIASALIGLASARLLASLRLEHEAARLAERAQAYYGAHGTLEGFAGQPGEDPPGDVQGLIDLQFRAVIPTFGYDPGEIVPAEVVKAATPVKVEGKTIAWVLQDPNQKLALTPEDELRVQRAALATGLAALAGLAGAAAVGFWLAGRQAAPLQRLTRAAQPPPGGESEMQALPTSQDEIGQLAVTLYQLRADLDRAALERKRLVADLLHDLSGLAQATARSAEPLGGGQAETLAREAGHLRCLVEALATLDAMEAGQLTLQLQPVQPVLLFEQILLAYQPVARRQGVEITLESSEWIPAILADEGRLLQVLENLVENALRYTPAGGRITLGISASERIELRVADTGPYIEPEALPYVFERFYPVGEGGLASGGRLGPGLAICKGLVTAQGGTIRAESASQGAGACMVLTFHPATEADPGPPGLEPGE